MKRLTLEEMNDKISAALANPVIGKRLRNAANAVRNLCVCRNCPNKHLKNSAYCKIHAKLAAGGGR